jgi:hypothetical protein
MRCISTFYRRAQRQRRGCSIPPEYLLNLSGRGAQSHAEYSIEQSFVTVSAIKDGVDPTINERFLSELFSGSEQEIK